MCTRANLHITRLCTPSAVSVRSELAQFQRDLDQSLLVYKTQISEFQNISANATKTLASLQDQVFTLRGDQVLSDARNNLTAAQVEYNNTKALRDEIKGNYSGVLLTHEDLQRKAETLQSGKACA